MKPNWMHLAGAAALSLAGAALSQTAHAQATTYTFTAPGADPHSYGLLNGDLLSLYINDRGDLGAPHYFPRSPEKPVGLIDGAGQAFVNNAGAIAIGSSTQPAVTYGALFTNQSTAGLPTIGDRVRAKREYITVGGGSVAEGYSVTGNSSFLNNGGDWLQARDLEVRSFTTNNQTSATGLLKATSTLFAPSSGTEGLLINQEIAFQDSSSISRNRVKFTVTLTNNTAAPLDGLRYSRIVDPNQGGTLDNPVTRTGQTNQIFRTPTDPPAFAIDSIVGSRHLGLGVLPSDGNLDGTIILAVPEVSESGLLSRPADRLNTSKYVRLGVGNSAKWFQPAGNPDDTTDDLLLASTNDYATDLSFNPNFGAADNGNVSLMLLSPTLSLNVGESQTFIFYYLFDPINGGGGPNPGVPEPGTIALLVGGLTGGLFLRRRRK